MAFLEISNFNKSFNKTEVLKGINFSMEKGEVVSIIGSSGSGKTTLLRCINFLETPDIGKMTLDKEVLLDSSSTEKITEKNLAKKRINFGLVFQSFNLFPQYTVFKNLTLAPTLMAKERAKLEIKDRKKRKEYIKAEKVKIREKAIKMLEKVGLTNKSYNYPCELSGGQCQRVAIARALALTPKVLCFDEPTSALDPELTGEVLKVIKGLKNKDTTMIIVTHEMEFAKNVSDKVIFMADGVVEEMGTPKEIFNSPKSEKLKNFLSKTKLQGENL